MGEVFSGGEEGPGSLARHLRVGRNSESPGATLPFTGKSTCQGLPCKISVSRLGARWKVRNRP